VTTTRRGGAFAQTTDKHHHHGGAARPSSGMDLMNPCRLRGVVVREVSFTKEITFYRSTKWTKDRPTPPILASSKRKNKKK